MRGKASRRIKLIVAYDGTDYCGWQRQSSDPSVQQTLEEALTQIHKETITVAGSGRTDSGVHANGQVVHFDAPPISLPPEKYPQACNALLPPDVRVLSAASADSGFDARRSARTRIYHYVITAGSPPPPYEHRYCWYRRHRPSIARLNRLASSLPGTHDFTAFSAAGDASESKVRRIFTAAFRPAGNKIVFEIAGNAFLWRMVRSLTGTLLELEEAGAAPGEMASILHSADRSRAGTSAPPRGLFLQKVLYEEDMNGYLW